MYQVRIWKMLQGAGGKGDIYFCRDIEMPFPPYTGLSIEINEWGEKVQDVGWNPEEPQKFNVHLEDDESLCDQVVLAGLPADESQREIALSYKKKGWLLETHEN